jgi:NAD(P)H-dependent flavin oxidoreductase YrpB (nitropropane dioxygenase family)
MDPDAYRRYAASLRADAERYGIDALPDLTEDDDHYPDKVALLLEDPVPVVSFTFGLPSVDVVGRLRQHGSVVLQTVTSPSEARAAAERGADAVVVQAAAAGGHSGIFDAAALPPDVPLPALVGAVRAVVDLPVIGTGGVGSAADVAAALAAGAAAVAVGTAVLRSPEAGTSAVHRAALADPAFSRTALTRAYTGRPARGLVNRFLEDHDGEAPVGYPAVHHLTRPIRVAAAAAGDPSAVHLWAGTRWRAAREAPVAEILAGLLP